MNNFFEEDKYFSLEEVVDEEIKKMMENFFHNYKVPLYQEGDIVEGEIIDKRGNVVWLSIDEHFIGFIPPRELDNGLISVSDLKIGDRIKCTILEPESEEGYIILSLRRAGREQAWEELKKYLKEKTILTIKPYDANKGGLLVEIRGIRGFLPVSQLNSDHYPRVKDGDPEEIYRKISQLVGQPLKIRVISAVPEENKLIVSEKEAYFKEREEIIDKYKKGDIVKGKVIGIADFGAFIDLGDVEGLVHISEISWERVNDIKEHIKEDEEIEVMVIGKENGKISLSLKRLKNDPWASILDNLKIGDKIKGTVTRLTPFGAFVKLENGLDGLIHISELSDKHINNPSEVVSLGDSLNLKVINIDPLNHKIELSLKQLNTIQKDKKELIKKEIKLNQDDSIDLLRGKLSKFIVDSLKKAGFKKIKDLLKSSEEELRKIPGIGSKTAESILKIINKIE